MSAQHTPTPWRICEPMGDEKPAIVSTTADGKVDYYIAEMIGGYKAEDADAAFIVRACNAHDELVAALRVIVNSEEFHGDTVVCDFQTLQGVARAALAKAGAP